MFNIIRRYFLNLNLSFPKLFMNCCRIDLRLSPLWCQYIDKLGNSWSSYRKDFFLRSWNFGLFLHSFAFQNKQSYICSIIFLQKINQWHYVIKWNHNSLITDKWWITTLNLDESKKMVIEQRVKYVWIVCQNRVTCTKQSNGTADLRSAI